MRWLSVGRMWLATLSRTGSLMARLETPCQGEVPKKTGHWKGEGGEGDWACAAV